MLDTIWCSFPVVIPWHKLKGWSKKTSLNTYKNYYYKQNNGIQFKYYYNQYKDKMRCPRLRMEFSASTMQNGLNAIAYDFGKSHIAVKEIEKTIAEVVGRPISLEEITCFSRIDINRDHKCKKEVEKQQLFNFFKKIRGRSGMKRKVYETGLVIKNDDMQLKFYFKDKDKNLGDEICFYMPKMARTEFQIKSYRIGKYYPENLNLYALLTNKRMTAMVWDGLLNEFHIGGEICDEQTLRKEAKKVLGNTKRIRARKLRQLKQIIDVID